MIQTLLQAAMFATVRNDHSTALNYLSEARELARKGTNQRCQIIAVHCTAAMQALYPIELEGHLAA